MGNKETSVAIITHVPAGTPNEYLVRTMKDVDEQSAQTWHHYMFCDDEDTLKRATRLLSLRNTSYTEKLTLSLSQSFFLTIFNDHEFFSFHPVRDYWSPFFIEKMLLELQSCSVAIGGVWCQYSTVHEAIRGKTFSIDKTEKGPAYTGELLRPIYSRISTAQHIQALYYSDAVPTEAISLRSHPLFVTLSALMADADILAIPDVLAFRSFREETTDERLEFQQIRNWIYRHHPYVFLIDTEGDI